jgi:hypothetical protein
MGTTGATTYDEFVFTTGDELWDRIHQAHRRFAALLSVTPHRTQVPGSDWTAGEVAGHVLTVLRRYTRRDLTSTEGLSPEGIGVRDQNAVELEELGTLGVAEILDQLWQEVADIEKLLPRTMDLHERFPFHGGQEMDAAAALGNLIGEFLVHGRDVAKARGKQWKIGSRNAALAMNIGLQAAGGYVSPAARGDLKVELRTPETNPWILEVVDGEATSRLAVPGERVDVRVFGRTQPLLLNLYGRIGLAHATALGTVVVGGRRPWRITRLSSTFLVP